jgi:hypothetical protein
MKKIGRDIKKILSGLSYQNAGDFLSRKEKLVVLGHKPAKQNVNNVVDTEMPEKEAA